MKKLIPVIFVFFLLSGCRMEYYTSEIKESFEQKATITYSDFSFDCAVKKEQSVITVTVQSTSAEGLSMCYDGQTLNYSYRDFQYSVTETPEATNPAVIIYEVFAYISDSENPNAKKTETGFQYGGKTNLSAFILDQNDDNTFQKLQFRSADITIDFK